MNVVVVVDIVPTGVIVFIDEADVAGAARVEASVSTITVGVANIKAAVAVVNFAVSGEKAVVVATEVFLDFASASISNQQMSEIILEGILFRRHSRQTGSRIGARIQVEEKGARDPAPKKRVTPADCGVEDE